MEYGQTSSAVCAFRQENDIALTIVRAKVCGDATQVFGDTGETVSRCVVETASPDARGAINVREFPTGTDRVPGTAVIGTGVRPRPLVSVLPEMVDEGAGCPCGVTSNPRDINRGRTSRRRRRRRRRTCNGGGSRRPRFRPGTRSAQANKHQGGQAPHQRHWGH